ELAVLADINIEKFASAMFNAGSNLKNKTDKEIFYQDFKKFSVNGVNFGVGQINSMNAEELNEIKSKLNPYMKTALLEQGLDMLYFMLTNIVMESTELLCCGTGAKEQILDAFDLSQDTEMIKLTGVVSRKKQLIPNFVGSLQQ
ncbi:MAG: DHHA2 domain-containing protein, partial [Lachnospiraceae bacterium]